MANRTNNGPKISTQLGRLVAMLIVAGAVWLVDRYILNPAPAETEVGGSVSSNAGNSQSAPATTSVPASNSTSTSRIDSVNNDRINNDRSSDSANTANPESATGFPGGYPQADRPDIEVKILNNIGYSVGYSEQRQTPLWAIYKLSSQRTRDQLRRPDRFEADARVAEPVEYYDYTRSGYTRGHLAPSYSIGRTHGAKAQIETFLMTNITPQLENFNLRWWQRLEEVIISHFAKRLKTVWVVTGPVYDRNRERLKSGVDIPDAFFKVVLIKTRSGTWQSLAFLAPQTAAADASLSQYITSIDNIELATGLDLFAAMDDSVENTLEASTEVGSVWKFSTVDNLPARY